MERGLRLWQVGFEHRVGLYALRDLKPGEEVTIDYHVPYK
jgi:SET domain-containing protein